MSKDSVLLSKSEDFAVNIIELYKSFISEKRICFIYAIIKKRNFHWSKFKRSYLCYF